MSQSREELNWLAFRYVAGELSDAETADFEGRLEADQAAREAIAAAVELSQGVTLACRNVDQVSGTAPAVRSVAAKPSDSRHVANSSTWLQRASWMALGAALCLTFVFVLRNKPAQHRELSPVTSDFVSAWSAAREHVEQVNRAQQLDSQDDPELVEVESPAVPSWMLAAVSKSPADDGEMEE